MQRKKHNPLSHIRIPIPPIGKRIVSEKDYDRRRNKSAVEEEFENCMWCDSDTPCWECEVELGKGG